MGYRGHCWDRLPVAMLTLLMLLLFEVLCYLENLIRNEANTPPYLVGKRGQGWRSLTVHAVACMQPWFVVQGARAQPGQAPRCGTCSRADEGCAHWHWPTGSRNHAKVVCNQLSLSKGNSSMWGLVLWAGSVGQLLGAGVGTCSSAPPQCWAFIQRMVLATVSNQMLIKYNIHGKWGRLNPRLNMLSCHLWVLSFFLLNLSSLICFFSYVNCAVSDLISSCI